MSTVTTILLAHNEEALLNYTLRPVKQVSDQVIIVDMGSTDGSHDLYTQILGPDDLVLHYPRDNLFRFGFSHARNYGASYAKGKWIFVVDCDEFIDAEATREALSALDATESNYFRIIRRNYKHTSPFTLGDLPALLNECPFIEEEHQRLYRNKPTIRFEGMIHEELWNGDTNAYESAKCFPIVLNHLNQFKPNGNEHAKFGLYSYITLRAILYPNMRYGTNLWWFHEFPKQAFDAMISAARDFADGQGIEAIEPEIVRAQLRNEGIELP